MNNRPNNFPKTPATLPSGLIWLFKILNILNFQKIGLSKRQKIILATIIITIGLISTETINYIFISYRFIIGLGMMAYFLSLWALWEGMTKQKAVLLLILPTLFTVAVASFYFLLPLRWLTRLPIALIFGLSFYSLLLSQNVFNVAATRTIPLYRAASTVSFLFTLITAFFLFNVVNGFDLPFYLNGVVVFFITFPLIFQILWTVGMEKIGTLILMYSFIISLIVGESALALSFWPLAPTIWSIFLSTLIYVLVAIVTEFMRDRLSKRLVLEYLGVGTIVLIFSFIVTSWTG